MCFDACSKLTSIYFQSNAPSVGSDVFGRDHSVTIYDLPGTTGWTNFAQATGLAPVLWLLPNPTIAHSGNSVIVSWPNSGKLHTCRPKT